MTQSRAGPSLEVVGRIPTSVLCQHRVRPESPSAIEVALNTPVAPRKRCPWPKEVCGPNEGPLQPTSHVDGKIIKSIAVVRLSLVSA